MLEIEERVFADVTVLAPRGRIDQQTATAFQERLTEAFEAPGTPLVVLDFSGVDYISSVGLRAIMIGSKRAKATGGRLAVAALRPTVDEVFQISRFNYVVEIFADVSAALSAFSEAAATAQRDG